ncbi:hypothetical protein F9279_19095 [Bacillus sp. B1-b2]|nr:hypothetical protein F9279_19095 [Bacillus sp. B1-b2]
MELKCKALFYHCSVPSFLSILFKMNPILLLCNI